eukprot:3273358-Pleurochrysis_carterae.AAC.1
MRPYFALIAWIATVDAWQERALPSSLLGHSSFGQRGCNPAALPLHSYASKTSRAAFVCQMNAADARLTREKMGLAAGRCVLAVLLLHPNLRQTASTES